MSCLGNTILMILPIILALVIACIPYWLVSYDLGYGSDAVNTKTITFSLDETNLYPTPHIVMTICILIVLPISVIRQRCLTLMLINNNRYNSGVRGLNIAAYVSAILGLITFAITVLVTKGIHMYIHAITADICVAGALFYHLFHIILTVIARKGDTCNCGNFCDWLIKYFDVIILIILWCISCYGAVMFGIDQLREDILLQNTNARTIFEWTCYFTVWAMFSLFSIIFYREPWQMNQENAIDNNENKHQYHVELTTV